MKKKRKRNSPVTRSCLPPRLEVSVVSNGSGADELSRTSTRVRSTPRRSQTAPSASLQTATRVCNKSSRTNIEGEWPRRPLFVLNCEDRREQFPTRESFTVSRQPAPPPVTQLKPAARPSLPPFRRPTDVCKKRLATLFPKSLPLSLSFFALRKGENCSGESF